MLLNEPQDNSLPMLIDSLLSCVFNQIAHNKLAAIHLDTEYQVVLLSDLD